MIKTLHEILKSSPDMTYNDAIKVQKNMRLVLENKATGVCVTAAVRKDIQQNRPLTDTMDERAYYELKNENQRLKKRVREAEGETSIIKGIGMNSPEMKTAQARIKELENSLSISLETNDQYQRNNKKLITDNDDLRDKLQVKILETTVNT